MAELEQSVKLRITTARTKLQTLFPQDPKGDITIVMGKKVFKLQKAFLRLESRYLGNTLTPNMSVLNIDQAFDQSHFEKVMSCFYGMTIDVKRSQVLSYFRIIKFLDIESLLKFLREDMVKNITTYDLFILMRLAHEYSEQEIFESCLNELDKENYEQLNYQQYELLKSSDELFKLIIKTHNRAKNEGSRGLPYSKVDELIVSFCEEKNYTEDQYQEMKFELIDKNALTSNEYKEIFLEGVKSVKKSFIGSNSFIKSQPAGFMFGNQSGLNGMVKPSNLAESMISPMNKPPVPNELTLEMENTFEKKLNQELKSENEVLKRELEGLKTTSESNKKNAESLKNTIENLQSQLKAKEEDDKRQKSQMGKMEKTIEILLSQSESSAKLIQSLEEKVSKIEKNSSKKYVVDSDEQEDNTIQSQIVPAHLIGQMMPGAGNNTPSSAPSSQVKTSNMNYGEPKSDGPSPVFKKKSNNVIEVPTMLNSLRKDAEPNYESEEELDDEDLEEMYMPRLAFVEEPLTVPKKYLPTLADLTTEEGWNKKKLTPIYRRSKEHSLGKASDLRNKNELLILSSTQYGQYIGGYVTTGLPGDTSGQFVEDRGAFLFTLSKKQKFAIEKQEVSEAIFLSDAQLISFGSDWIIPLDIASEKSECNWPGSYVSNKYLSQADWLIGGKSPFFLDSLEVYEVQEAEMEMVL